jgi:hypothetical protein
MTKPITSKKLDPSTGALPLADASNSPASKASHLNPTPLPSTKRHADLAQCPNGAREDLCRIRMRKKTSPRSRAKPRVKKYATMDASNACQSFQAGDWQMEMP